MIRLWRPRVKLSTSFSFRPRIATAAAIAMVLGLGCGEPNAPPEPVASISFATTGTVLLVPGGTELLVPLPKGASGKPLTDRQATWTSSDNTIVDVAAGLVTGVKKGSATVSVSIEGIVSIVNVEVRDGSVVSAAGAAFSVFDGAVSVSVPAGALTQARSISVQPATSAPPARRFVQGTAYEFGPNGATFASPVVIKIKYDPSKVTTGSPEAGLQLYEAVSGAWRVVDGSTVNTTEKTVTGSVSHFSIYGILMQPIVDTVRITSLANIPVRTTVQLSAVVKDSAGATLTRPITWATSAPSILQVDPATGSATSVIPGTATVTATSEGKSGTAVITVVAGPAAHLLRVTSETVNGAAGVALATPPAVKVTDAFGNGVAGFTVTFAVTSGGGTVVGGTAITSVNGFASPTSWTLGTAVGTNTLTATATGLPESPMTFTAVANAGPAATIAANSSVTLTGTANGNAPTPPSVKVVDAFGNPVAGSIVTFTPASGSGSVTPTSVATNSAGVATVDNWRFGVTPGPQTLLATLSGVGGSPVTFTATTAAPVPSSLVVAAGNGQTAVTLSTVAVLPSVRVTDPAGVPVPGLAVTFAVASGGGTVTGGNAVTNADGIATIGSWILGGTPGENTLSVSAGSLTPVTITATAVAPTPVAIALVGGQGQTVGAGAPVPILPSVKVTDAQGRGVPGIPVVFSVILGGGTVTGGSTVTNSSGIATVGSWTLGIGNNQLAAVPTPALSGTPVVFNATGVPFIQVVTFGDSNTDYGYQGTDPTIRATSYVSNTTPRLGPNAPNSPLQVAGKIETKWRGSRPETIKVVNHGIASTRTGTGRTGLTSPNGLEVVNGLTRFEGEVLGLGYPWNGGETPNSAFPNGPILRVNAFRPRSNDFVYVSLGTNDLVSNVNTDNIAANLSRFVDLWIAAGLPANHFIITTLPPRDNGTSTFVPGLNVAIRRLATNRGLRLIDLAAFASNDDGISWRLSSLHVDNDFFHYSEEVRTWLADRVFEIINAP